MNDVRWWERPFVNYLERRHGKPDADYQYQFYRCAGCTGLVTWNMIKRGGCNCFSSNQLRPTYPSMLERIRLLVLPWTVR